MAQAEFELFLVAYDLRSGEDYEELISALRKMGGERIQESVWYLAGRFTCTKLKNILKTNMQSDDRLMVVRFDDWSGWNNLTKIAQPA
jgi:CRISPR/Cas system-associated endoribonuclease Cas2